MQNNAPDSANEIVRDQVRKELRREQSRKRTRWAVGCLAFFAAGMLVLAFVVAWVAAKSEIAYVPFLSEMVANPAMPERVVVPPNGAADALAAKAFASGKLLADGSIAFDVSESAVTAFARIACASEKCAPLMQPQVAIDAGAAEVFAHVVIGGRIIPIKAIFDLTPGDHVQLALRESEIGSLPLPPQIFSGVVSSIQDQLNKQLASLPLARIHRIEAFPGKLTVIATLSHP